MKAIAEIVAKESYNDIPNKNIRDIVGFPMITNCLYTLLIQQALVKCIFYQIQKMLGI